MKGVARGSNNLKWFAVIWLRVFAPLGDKRHQRKKKEEEEEPMLYVSFRKCFFSLHLGRDNSYTVTLLYVRAAVFNLCVILDHLKYIFLPWYLKIFRL